MQYSIENIVKIIIFLLLFSCDFFSENSELNENNLRTSEIFINQNIEGKNFSRSVLIQAPSIINKSKNYPIVMAFHGRGGTNQNWINLLKKYTDNGDFVGIYPQGYLKSWNLATENLSFGEPSTADDVEFVNLIINELKNYPNLDFNKVYAIGNSNGSGMVNKLALETTYFKAIAPIVSQLTEAMIITNTTQPISVFQVNGAKDNLIPIDGGQGPGTHIFLDALVSAEYWASSFSCSDAEQFSVGSNFSENGINKLYLFKNCQNGKQVRYLRLENGYHNVLSSYTSLVEEIWDFFKKY